VDLLCDVVHPTSLIAELLPIKPVVIPAKAGIQWQATNGCPWVPAYAGDEERRDLIESGAAAALLPPQ
jgi:hypothetical protein